MSDFVHLHRHGEWSLGDGIGTSETYAERAAELNQAALSITDHASLAGTLYHMQACEKVGIKPILGMEAYFRPNITEDRENKKQFGYFHLILLAQNEKGWKNLMRISSASHDDFHYYQKPSVDWELLVNNSEGLIATSSCLAGYIPQAVMQQDYERVNEHLERMQSLFGDRFYFEIQPHDIAEQISVNKYIVDLARSRGIPFIATADVHSPFEDWVETQKIKDMIGKNKSVKDKKKEGTEEKEYGGIPTTYLMSDQEIRKAFTDFHFTLTSDEVETAIKTTLEVADRCDHIVVDKSPKVPKATKSTLESLRVLREWSNEGLVRIGKESDPVYTARLEEELAMIKHLKVADYFVIVGDMVRWAKSDEPLPSVKAENPDAKKRPIRVGPGRGSAAGSLVCYLIRITALDPIGYNLLFERFLNEYRTEIPDVDIDFDPNRRPEVKEYMVEKWGKDYVIDVAAFQSFGLKAAVKDVARALGVSYDKTTKATDSIPRITFGETLESLEKQLPVLKAYFDEFPDVRRHSMRLQGQIKGSSKHAAAVIVTDRPAEDIIPMMRAKDGSITTQWSERANAQLLSPYGFLKIDMLVTEALASQDRALQLIEERHGIKYDFEDPKQFPVVESPFLSDPDVVETFGHGRMLGIFQFASHGAVGLLKDIKPENLDHIIAANALNRPGTLGNGMAEEYAKRKNGKEWSLPHEAMEPFLGTTYGVIVFQEQVMQIYRALGKDVESAESAVFLKVVAKGIARDLKGKEKLQAYYEKFAAGCEEKGIPKKAYKTLWDQILAMTTYAFNRSHSAGYGLQAYQDGWLKHNYTLEFYEPLLSNEDKKTGQIVRESRAYGLKILPPDINTSNAHYTVDGNAIRFGLLAIKGVADAGIAEIKRERPFASLADFEDRVAKRKVNSAARKALVDCGAFDTIGERADWTILEKAAAEREILGTALSAAADVVKHKKLITEYTDRFDKLEEMAAKEETVSVGGEIVKITESKTKNGDLYARIDIEFDGEEIQVIFWSEQYKKFRQMLAIGAAILVAGSYDVEYGNVSVSSCITAEQLSIEIKKEKSDASRSKNT